MLIFRRWLLALCVQYGVGSEGTWYCLGREGVQFPLLFLIPGTPKNFSCHSLTMAIYSNSFQKYACTNGARITSETAVKTGCLLLTL